MDEILLELAKKSIAEGFEGTDSIDRTSLLKRFPELAQERAVFVTLNLYGNLRGCIGSLVAHRSLMDDVIYNAKAAAFSDFRFAPLSKEEFENVEIEISILSVPKPLDYSSVEDLKSKISVGKDGVILSLNGYRATFLPQVWEKLPTFELFFSHLCQKAGLGGKCLDEHPEIQIYQVQKLTQ